MGPGRYGASVRRDDFIPPAPTDEAEFFRGATVVLDTNVLLALYKLSASARNEALRAIESTLRQSTFRSCRTQSCPARQRWGPSH